ncbi:MerR family transcriptional regulator [Actinospica sp.]|jgi:DNA-binding transcriptional MerR regulator|uniref:MerR family transcriptional regulator n=1 Tax=Actinospica sp. TaxID=1872142 RepID=UPI002C88A005|nr:MerR family transcriptional regulator [Actinospica sp.]HWG28535.1 MerR family transcriptional regulator [Actinospica sp.]
MDWSIAEVARMSGLTSRTLRHYDDIGLLSPAFVGANGYRYYGQEELLRLQQIRVLRELGVGLPEIGRILDEQTDRVQALREHHKRLLGERDRLGTLAATVARTIRELEQPGHDEGEAVRINRPENLFEGFDSSQYDDEARRRWPEEFAESQRRAAAMTAEDMERIQRETTANMIRMAELMAAATPVDDEAVQEAVHEHYVGLCRWWTPNAQAYTCVGRMYVDDERFTATYDKIAVGLAAYYRDAIAHYARTRLS